jgi:hypothetical protein
MVAGEMTGAECTEGFCHRRCSAGTPAYRKIRHRAPCVTTSVTNRLAATPPAAAMRAGRLPLEPTGKYAGGVPRADPAERHPLRQRRAHRGGHRPLSPADRGQGVNTVLTDLARDPRPEATAIRTVDLGDETASRSSDTSPEPWSDTRR